MRIIAYYVFDPFNGGRWLQEDEKSWGDFAEAQSFNDCDLAQAIGEREAPEGATVHIFGLLS